MKPILSESGRAHIQRIITEAGDLAAQKQAAVSPLREKYINSPTSVVTQVDIDTENLLRDQLHKPFPSFGFYSEESSESSQKELDKEYAWVVDPIDGTLNYSRGLPLWAVSVGLMQAGKSVFGALYFPKLRDYFWALKGSGAYRNHGRLAVRPTKNISGAFLAAASGKIYRQSQKLNTFFKEERVEVNCSYCTVYNYAYTATGSYNGVISIETALWDIAAGSIIVEEAGGMFEMIHEDKKAQAKNDPYYISSIAGHQSFVEKIKPEMIKALI